MELLKFDDTNRGKFIILVKANIARTLPTSIARVKTIVTPTQKHRRVQHHGQVGFRCILHQKLHYFANGQPCFFRRQINVGTGGFPFL